MPACPLKEWDLNELRNWGVGASRVWRRLWWAKTEHQSVHASIQQFQQMHGACTCQRWTFNFTLSTLHGIIIMGGGGWFTPKQPLPNAPSPACIENRRLDIVFAFTTCVRRLQINIQIESFNLTRKLHWNDLFLAVSWPIFVLEKVCKSSKLHPPEAPRQAPSFSPLSNRRAIAITSGVTSFELWLVFIFLETCLLWICFSEFLSVKRSLSVRIK